MIKTILVDDEQLNIDVLQVLIKKHCPALLIASTAQSVPDALIEIRKHKPDVLFLDIEIFNETAFDLLDQLNDPNMMVVLVTAYSQYALDGYEYAIIDYILKPIRPERLMDAVEKIITQFEFRLGNHVQEDSFKYIALPTSNEFDIASIDEIIRLEADNNYTKLFLLNGKEYRVAKTLKQYEDKLPKDKFVRVHKSHIVNLHFVQKYANLQKGNMMMTVQTEIPIARTQRTKLNERFIF